ncbi:MAG: sulfite exporter TauE/SafE family protein [Alphaproteobacteria bacterium]|nr:sulfite exporter TauE/SafE family protein [Alphaproteobacteria bacterium]
MNDIFVNLEWVDILVLVLMLAALGAVAGVLAGLLGVGGGIVLVPGLYLVFTSLPVYMSINPDYLMHVCVGTSLSTIVFTGCSSVLAHRRYGAVDSEIIKLLGLGILIGVALATIIADKIDSLTLEVFFACALILFASAMIINPARYKWKKKLPGKPFQVVAGSIIGFVSTLIGIGGATMSVPFLSVHGVEMRKAVGTASALGLVISIPASLGFIFIGQDAQNLPPFSFGYVNLLAWLCIVPVSVGFAPLGARLAHSVDKDKLRLFFAAFIILVALNMWRRILTG